MRQISFLLAGLFISLHAAATLPPCLKPTNAAGAANPGFNATDPRIASDGLGGYYQKVTPVQITICTGTTAQCGDSSKASTLLDGTYSSRVTISTAAAGYAPVGSVADFARMDACLNLVEGTSILSAKNGSATDPQNLAGRLVPTLDVNGSYVANSGGQFTITVPPMPSGLTTLNAVPWALNGKTIKYQSVVPRNFTGIGISHQIAWDRITAVDGGPIDALFGASGKLGTNYAFMRGMVDNPSDVAMATRITAGGSTFGNFYASSADPIAMQNGGRRVLSFQCPDDMTLAGADTNDLAVLGYTRRSFFLAPAELALAANTLERNVVTAADAGNPPPTSGSIQALRTYLQGLPGSSDIRVVDLVITRRYGLGLWGTLFAVTQATVPAAVTSGSPKAMDYFLTPNATRPVAMPYSWAYNYLTGMEYTPLTNISTSQFDGFYWNISPSPFCRPKNANYDLYNPYAGRSLN